MEEERKALAERFLRGVYGGDPTVVDDLAAEDVVSSYPVFERLFGTPCIRGRAALKEFATGFGQRWADGQITIHEAVAAGDSVVLVWEFRARRVAAASEEPPPTDQVHHWGGITFFRFNASGKIVLELGEESAPGPVARVAAGSA
jgi:hypothetical protein